MRKVILTIAATAILGVSFAAPKANAIVGFATGSKVTKVIGGVIGVGGGVGIAATARLWGEGIPALKAIPLLFGVVAVVGIVILDDGTTSDIRYVEINQDQANKLGLTKSQMNEFNANVEIFNAIKDDISSNISDKTSQQEITSGWNNALKELNVSKDATIGLVKVTQAIFQK